MTLNRRELLFGASLYWLTQAHSQPAQAKPDILRRSIPTSGENIPAVGMGTWLTFDVNPSGAALEQRVAVLKAFFAAGGGMIDSSPMYGRSENVLGQCLSILKFPKANFSATKVWTSGKASGIEQMENSLALWKQKRFDLMQIHNLVDWRTHVDSLLDWKKKGRIRYLGITTYGGLKHSAMIQVMKNYPLDFIQATYNIVDREVEDSLLPVAQERGIAVIANRPFQGGNLFNYVRNKKLPPWAAQIDCRNWAQFFLKFIVSHPGITCAIPATSQVVHMQQNMGSLLGELPKPAMRKKMLDYFKELS